MLDDADDTGLNGLYLSRETPPAVGNGQFAATGQADLEISVPAAAAGEWYVWAHYAFGTGTHTILAEATQLGLYAVSPEALGNAEEMSVVLSGAGFVTGTAVALVASGGTAYPGTVAVHSFRSLTATFAAGAVPPGVYSVRVDSPAGGSYSSSRRLRSWLAGKRVSRPPSWCRPRSAITSWRRCTWTTATRVR